MELYTDSDSPAIDVGVLKRLERLDKTLRVSFSRFSIDPEKSTPLPVHPGPDWEADARVSRRGNTWFLLDPAYHLWSRDPEGRYWLVQSYPAETGFGHREVAKLEADVARYMRPSEIIDQYRRAQADRQERRRNRFSEVRKDVVKENQGPISDILGGAKTTRQAKIMSYGGQGKRSTPGEVEKSDREVGWVRPTPDDYAA